MNLKQKPDGVPERLGHIVLMLLSLAVLAECAAFRPLHVRLYVFRILRRAEYAAVALFIDQFDGFSAEALRNAEFPDESQATHDNLIRLAFSLRTIAALLVATQLSSWLAARQVTSAKYSVGNQPCHSCAPPVPAEHDTS